MLPSISFVTTVIVNQTLTSIVVSPNTASVLQGATQQFTAQALDQFHQPMANQPAFTWSASAGTVSTAGLFTAPSSAGSCTVTAKSGSVTGTATVTIVANPGPARTRPWRRSSRALTPTARSAGRT